MSSFEIALTTWLSVLSSHGCEISHIMNPGATPRRIAAIESAIGYEFTDDLKKLYMWADGERDYRRDAMRRLVHYPDGGADMIYELDPSPGKYFCPLFGNYTFDGLTASLDSYLGWLDILDDIDEEYNRDSVSVRRGDAVHKQYFRKGWFPISNNSTGNAYAIDFDPPEGGTYGQVIMIGPDEDRRVIASSITDMLTRAANCKSVNVELSYNGRHSDPIFMEFDIECW